MTKTRDNERKSHRKEETKNQAVRGEFKLWSLAAFMQTRAF